MAAKKQAKKTQKKAKLAKTPTIGDLSPKETEAVKGAVSGGGLVEELVLLGRKKG